MKAHVLQHVSFEGIGSIGAWLQARQAETSFTRFFQGDRLPGPEGTDLVLVLGGPMSANLGRRVIGLQFHLEATPDSIRALAANCSEELIPSSYIQSETKMLQNSPLFCTNINNIMSGLLTYITDVAS